MDIPFRALEDVEWLTQVTFFARIVLAAICGCIIGYERSRRLKGAGVRTHMVVALSSALMTVVSKYGFLDVRAIGLNVDASRIAASIITGIPFLGAGVIFVRKDQSSVQGLTTAAGLWATCGIGMALGAGMYLIGVLCTILLMLLQLLLHRVLTGYDASFSGEMIIVSATTVDTDGLLNKLLGEYSLTIQKTKINRFEGGIEYTVGFKTKRDIPANALAKMIEENAEIKSIEI